MTKQQWLRTRLFAHPLPSEDFLLPRMAKEFFDLNHPKLNNGQRRVFECLKDAVLETEHGAPGKLMFLDARGGTGKTLTLSVFVCWLIMEGRKVATLTTSGIAATLLHQGRTAHTQHVQASVSSDKVFDVQRQKAVRLSKVPVCHFRCHHQQRAHAEQALF